MLLPTLAFIYILVWPKPTDRVVFLVARLKDSGILELIILAAAPTLASNLFWFANGIIDALLCCLSIPDGLIT